MEKGTSRYDAAARKIQNAFRSKQARIAIKKLVRENYVKIYDRFSAQYVYKNRRTKEITGKPAFLGKDDLPTPRVFNAPSDYDPMDDFDLDGYALIVTVNKFNQNKLPEQHESSNSDHVLIEEVIAHDFICKYRQENVIFLKNPSCAEFLEALQRLRRHIRPQGFLFVYLSSHVVTVHGGDKKDTHETGYLCMRDTLWTRPAVIAATSISLSLLASSLNKIECKQKTIFLNYAHVPNTRRSPFGSKFLYPPPDFASRLARAVQCAVITNCTVGTSIAEVIRHTLSRAEIAQAKRFHATASAVSGIGGGIGN